MTAVEGTSLICVSCSRMAGEGRGGGGVQGGGGCT